MHPVITVQNLGKKYILSHQTQERYTALRDVLANKAKHLASKLIHPFSEPESNPSHEEFWALKDVSFEIQQGDRVGIIGRNGAGKSTLLKILSRITEPSSGQVKIKGRVASLLEIGTGFHPELTGRENIYLNGAILGMRKAAIKQKFDEIVAFAEIEKFLDTPVKQYSSGMYVRLAFAVAAHLDTDILIVDEVLAVGDAMFQRKCLGKMSELNQEGRTVLFVTHNMQALSTLTEKCILLANGYCDFSGKTEDAISRYIRPLDELPLFVSEPSAEKPVITRVEVVTSGENGLQQHGAPMKVLIEITAPQALENASVSFRVVNFFGQPILYLWRFDSEKPLCRQAGVYKLECHIPQLRLYQGQYNLTVYFSEKFGKKNPIKIVDICPFEVVMHGISHDFGWQADSCVYIETAQWEETLSDFESPQ